MNHLFQNYFNFYGLELAPLPIHKVMKNAIF